MRDRQRAARVRASCVTTLHKRLMCFVVWEFFLRHEGLLRTPSGHGCALRECEWRRERERERKTHLVVGRERICMSGRMSDGTGLGMFLKIDYLHRAIRIKHSRSLARTIACTSRFSFRRGWMDVALSLLFRLRMPSLRHRVLTEVVLIRPLHRHSEAPPWRDLDLIVLRLQSPPSS